MNEINMQEMIKVVEFCVAFRYGVPVSIFFSFHAFHDVMVVCMLRLGKGNGIYHLKFTIFLNLFSRL